MKKRSKKKGEFTLNEIKTQVQAWESLVKDVKKRKDEIKSITEKAEKVIFCGCGSALNVSMTAATTYEHFTGKTTKAVHSSEVFTFPEVVFGKNKKTLLLAWSRSGDTTETIKAVECAKARKMDTMALTCYPKSKITKEAAHTFILKDSAEKSIVTTKSLTSMILLGQLIAAVDAEDKNYFNKLCSLPRIGKPIIKKYQDLGRELGENKQIKKFVFLGTGPYLGLAREAQLKIKEMALLPSDWYPTLDFRHGPKSNVNGNTLVVVLMSDSAEKYEADLVKDVKEIGGKPMVLCDEADARIKKHADYLVELKTGFKEFERDILYMPVLQFMAFYKAMSKGLDPDFPKHLTYHVEIK